MKLKFIAILLLLILAISALTSVSEAVPEPSVGSNSSNNAKPSPDEGGNVTPEPDEPNEPEVEILATWHNYGDCVSKHDKPEIFECPSCSKTWTYNEFVMFDSECWGEGDVQGYFYCRTCSCGEQIFYESVHCFVNGECHGCGEKCIHSSYAKLAGYYLSYLPEGHPMKNMGEMEVNEMDSFVVEGVCLMCGMDVDTYSDLH